MVGQWGWMHFSICRVKEAFLCTAMLVILLIHSGAMGAEPVHLFSSFRGNGEDGLHLAASRDGIQWHALNQDKAIFRSKVGDGLMRDPCIIQGSDGVFHMVWTSGWQDQGIGLSHSRDLVNWSEPQLIPVMAEFPTAKNAWAPEIIWDDEAGHYQIFWASTLPGCYPDTEKQADAGWDHRIYATTTKDFRSYSPTKLYLQPDFNVIDSSIIRFQGRNVMALKDETRYPPAKHLRIATAETLQGPWHISTLPFTPDGVWVEGPTMLVLGEYLYVYFDRYTDHQYGAMRTTDLTHWQDVSAQLQVPNGMRHGTVLTVTEQVYAKLVEQLSGLED